MRHGGDHPMSHRERAPALRSALDAIAGDVFSPEQPGRYQDLVDSLLRGDHCMLLADYESYVAAQARVDELYRTPERWCERAILNVAAMGTFSSDRTIADYAAQIWRVSPVNE